MLRASVIQMENLPSMLGLFVFKLENESPSKIA